VQILAWMARSRAVICLYSAQNIEKRYPPPFRQLERIALRRSAAVHTCNDEAARIVRRKGFRGITHNLGLGVDVDLYDREGSRNDGPNGLLRVGYVGRLEARKGVHLLVEAMVQVPEATLEIIGEGPARDAIDEQIRSSGLTTRVSLSGHVEAAALPDRYANFDVLVVPSLETSSWIEQFGRVAIEGMAAGLVVIASASGSLPEVIGDAGVLVRPGDVGALAAALNRLGSDPEERARLGKLARKRSERFSWSSIAREQLEMYREMLVRGP
jgi:glycosyltransferase involved in cell wall biosynthesis